MKKKILYLFALVVAMGTNVQAQSLKNDYKLPDNVPAEVQADDFRIIREDFARFYEDFYHEALKADKIKIRDVEYWDKIKIRDVEYCAVKGGYALVFDVKFQDGKIRFACLRDGTFAIRKGTEVFNMEFDGHSGYSYFMPSASKLVYEITDNAFIVSLSGEGCLVLGN